jgi:DNA polymerase delta subunit 2
MAFMQAPSEGDMARLDPSELSPGTSAGRRSRLECSYEPFMKKFLWKDRSLLSQFDVLYDLRLRALSHAVRTRAQRQWPAEVFCERIVDARPNSTHILVGTLHKAMRLQPSVLDEYKEERGMSESIMLPAGKFSSMEDSVMLEDGSGRVRLCGAALDVQKLSTGIVVAVLGELQSSGEFLVTSWCPPGVPLPRKPPATISRPPGSLILLVSGLRCGKEGSNPVPLQLLTDFVGGYGAGEEASDIAARIVRVLICGDCVGGAGFLGDPSARGRMTAKESQSLAEPISAFDSALAQLCALVPVDVMPGPSDPSTYLLPQQPLHKCV